MASVIRIKRRRTEDPVEALLLSHKKSRRTDADTGTSPNDLNSTESESVLEFAGTLSSKDEPVSKHIKEAIRKKKIHKEMHPHSEHRSDLASKLRKQKVEASQNNRYKITYSRRALDIDNLDCEKEGNVNETEEKSSHNFSDDRLKSEQLSEENKENAQKLSECVHESQHKPEVVPSPSRVMGPETGKDASNLKHPADFCSSTCGASKKEEKIFCLIDVEHEKELEQPSEPAADVITVNGVPMAQLRTKVEVPIAEESDDYVYDLYFTHTRLADIHSEAVVTVEALCNEFLHDENPEAEDDLVYDDDDDSNDESNWRNDYPDEDPFFFENADKEYDYRNDMRESIFNGGQEGDDEGDLLSYWMDTRCRVGAANGSDSEDEYGRDEDSDADLY